MAAIDFQSLFDLANAPTDANDVSVGTSAADTIADFNVQEDADDVLMT